MAASKKSKRIETPRLERRAWRVNQRAHKFADRRKAASKNACRGKFRGE